LLLFIKNATDVIIVEKNIELNKLFVKNTENGNENSIKFVIIFPGGRSIKNEKKNIIIKEPKKIHLIFINTTLRFS
jgi:hypothetical protein